MDPFDVLIAIPVGIGTTKIEHCALLDLQVTIKLNINKIFVPSALKENTRHKSRNRFVMFACLDFSLEMLHFQSVSHVLSGGSKMVLEKKHV